MNFQEFTTQLFINHISSTERSLSNWKPLLQINMKRTTHLKIRFFLEACLKSCRRDINLDGQDKSWICNPIEHIVVWINTGNEAYLFPWVLTWTSHESPSPASPLPEPFRTLLILPFHSTGVLLICFTVVHVFCLCHLSFPVRICV